MKSSIILTAHKFCTFTDICNSSRTFHHQFSWCCSITHRKNCHLSSAFREGEKRTREVRPHWNTKVNTFSQNAEKKKETVPKNEYFWYRHQAGQQHYLLMSSYFKPYLFISKFLPPMHFRPGLTQGINLSQAFEADIGFNELQQSIWCNAFHFPKSTRQRATWKHHIQTESRAGSRHASI